MHSPEALGGGYNILARDDEPPGRNLCVALGLAWFGILGDVKAFEASYILSYNVVQDHEGDIHQGVSIAVSDRRS